MSTTEYISYGQYFSYVVNDHIQVKTPVIQIRLDELLVRYRRSFYWLAKETGISHTTLWRLKKGKALGINFETLEKLCQALQCQPGDVLALSDGRKTTKRLGAKGQPKR